MATTAPFPSAPPQQQQQQPAQAPPPYLAQDAGAGGVMTASAVAYNPAINPDQPQVTMVVS